MPPYGPPMNDSSRGDPSVLPPCFYIDLSCKRMEVQCPAGMEFRTEDEIKEWICTNDVYKKAIKDSIRIHRYGHRRLSYCDHLKSEENKINEERKQLDLLDMISKVQRQFLQSEQKKNVFTCLLEGLLTLTDSEYGFIDELHHNEDGTIYATPNAITNIAWNAATNNFYNDNIDNGGLRFTNLKSLWGSVVTTEAPVVANDAPNDPRASGIPEGHPPLKAFLGIPIFRVNGEIMGVIGVANKPGGYSQQDIDYLEPFTITCSNLIEAYCQAKKNEELIDKLEDMVQERTRKLQLVNESLEKAHRVVVEASAAQLQHFAQMSHEIRTPLNCIVGLSSLLQDTSNNLTPMQREWLDMMVSSGDLLNTVVNELLNYSKLETGNVDIDIQPSSLQETLNSVAHSIGMKSRSKNLYIKTIYDTDLPDKIYTDSCRLQQILYNLLGNAVKFSKEGGTVELRAELIQNDQNVLAACTCLSQRTALGPSMQDLRENLTTGSLITQESVVPEDAPQKSGPSPAKCPFGQGYPGSSPTGETQTPCLSKTDAASAEAPPGRCPFSRALTVTQTAQRAEAAAPERLVPPMTTSNSPSVLSMSSGLQSPTTAGYSGAPPSPKSNQGQTRTKPPYKRNSMQVLRLIVKDYGQGIEKKDFDRIFQPFLQATKETERVYGGTGLGLAITSKLVQGLGGTIKVDSEVGRWSEFTVNLPFQSVEPVDFDGITSVLRNTVVVLVDEDNAVAHRMKQILDRYEVSCVHLSRLDDGEFQKISMADIFRQKENTTPSKEGDQLFVVWLVQEDYYQNDAYMDSVSHLSNSNPNTAPASILLTYGPNFSTKDSKGHFRSLLQFLPSVLLKSIRTYIQEEIEHSINIKSNVAAGAKKKKSLGGVSTSTTTGSLAAYSSVTGMGFQDIRVLVADDNLINTKMLSRMLTRLGMKHIDVVDNGKKAVDKEAQKQYDVILMDMQMPVMDGVEACRLICARQRRSDHMTDGHSSSKLCCHPKPQIVFVTANVSSTYEEECAKAGACGFLPKPFNMSDLERCFRQLTAKVKL